MTVKLPMVTKQNVTIDTANCDNAKSGINDSQSTDGDKTENVTIQTANLDNAKTGINDSQSTDGDKTENVTIETAN